MQYQKNDVEQSFSVFMALLKTGKIHKRDSDIYNAYKKEEVIKIIAEVIEPQANVKIFAVDDTLYLVPNLDNEILSYSNQELRNLLKLKNNEDLYLAHFCILVLLSQFYNSDSQTLSTRQFIKVETIQKIIKKQVDEYKTLSESRLETQTINTGLDIQGIVNAWESLPQYNETAKNISRTRTNQIGFILRVLQFLEGEDLVLVRDDGEVSITEKMNRMIIYYFYNTQRKNQLLSLFQ